MFFKKKQPQFTTDSKFSEQKSWLAETVGERAAKTLGAIFEIAQIAVISLALVLLIRTFVVQPFSVQGASMEPNFIHREYLIIDEISYRFREPERGEIVVFRYPGNPSDYFIKRIIGLPGETVTISGGQIFIDGAPLEEPYLTHLTPMNEQSVSVKTGEYFLMGDNRPVSLDSRMFGPVRREVIVGKVWLRGWPPSRIDVIEQPIYNLSVRP